MIKRLIVIEKVPAHKCLNEWAIMRREITELKKKVNEIIEVVNKEGR